MRTIRARRLFQPDLRRRKVLVGGLVLLGALVISAIILARVGGLLSLFAPTGDTELSPNQGRSILVLSRPNLNRIAAVTLLTMVRTSDGRTLWQYPLPGDLANGLSSTAEDQLRAGTAVRIVNGVVYFAEVLDASPDRPALTTFRLTALRANTGARLWQRQMQATTLEVLGVSDGVLVARATTGDNYTVDELTTAGYRADTGVLVWERRLAEHMGYGSVLGQVLDGILYTVGPAGTASPGVFTAIDVRTGQTLWQPTGQRVGYISAITAADGVVVLAGTVVESGPRFALSVSGLRERGGLVLWSHELSPRGGFPGTLALPSYPASAGVLYFATNVPDQTDLELNALQISTGRLLWHRQVTAQRATTNQQSSGGRELVLANGMLYLLYELLAPAASPAASGLFVQAVRASDGVLGWRQLYRPGLTEAPALVIVEGTVASAVVVESTDSEHIPVLGLSAHGGAMLWRDQRIVYGELIADGKLVVFSVLPPPDLQYHEHLCALDPGTGAELWCDAVDGIGNWLIAGP